MNAGSSRRISRTRLPIVGALLAAAVMVVGAPGRGSTVASTDFEPWAQTARVAGASVWVGMTQTQVNNVITNMSAQNVSVIEADSNLSNYMTDAEFDQELALMRQFSTAAHAKGIRIGWYYPTFEVLTENGANIAHTMYKDHPDWVQVGLDGTPNVFYGNEVFWVEPNMESAWMSPSSDGYRAFYYDRVKRIAAAGLDYFWADVPLLYDVGTQWADISPSAASKFLADTGFASPSSPADMNWDQRWRRWISWRHEEVADFLTGIGDAGRSVNSNFKLIVETVTMDYASATKIGLDGSYLKDVPGVTHVWELDPVSNANAMRKAKEDDWIRMIAMNKYAHAASGDKPAWVFDYGKQANDAELVMAETIAAGNNPYESKIPIMTTTVGVAYRTKMFGWIKTNEPYLYGVRNAARVAVLYSPENRDFVDRAAGESMYATTTSADNEFWSTDAVDSVYQRQYLAEYNGMIKLLVHNHIPFDVIVNPSSAELARYQTVILPDIEAISDDDASLLSAYTTGGGHLLATGANPTGWDQYGTSRSEYALAAVLGLTKTAALPASKIQAAGAGEARFFKELLGKKYLTNATDAGSAASTLLTAINATTAPWLTTNANKKVHMELWQGDNTLMLHEVNFTGVTGTFAVTPTTSTTTLKVPVGKEVTAVELTSPDNATPARAPLAYTVADQDVTFTVSVTEYALVIVSLRDSGPVANRPPVANGDTLATTEGVVLGFTAGQLLVNDTDPDADLLSITGVDSSSTRGGSISGSYAYTPAPGFTGVDTFAYTLSDGRGGVAKGTVTVTVSPTTVNHSPVAVNDSYGTTANTALVVSAPGVLGNDSDPDGNALLVESNTAPSHGTVIVAPNGGFTYTPTEGFSGSDSFSYGVSDGNGASATGVVSIVVSPAGVTPQTVFPTTVTISTGKLDSGTMASLTAADGKTYDVRSAFVAAEAGGVTDWYTTTKMSGSPGAVTQITMTYRGQHSKASVSQQISLFNFVSNSSGSVRHPHRWQPERRHRRRHPDEPAGVRFIDRRDAGPGSRLRAGAQTTTNWNYLCWANMLKWDVK